MGNDEMAPVARNLRAGTLSDVDRAIIEGRHVTLPVRQQVGLTDEHLDPHLRDIPRRHRFILSL